MSKNRTQKKRNILSQMPWCLLELMEGTCGEGTPEDYQCFMSEISHAIKIYRFLASRMFTVVVYPTMNSSGRNLKISLRNQIFYWNVNN